MLMLGSLSARTILQPVLGSASSSLAPLPAPLPGPGAEGGAGGTGAVRLGTGRVPCAAADPASASDSSAILATTMKFSHTGLSVAEVAMPGTSAPGAQIDGHSPGRQEAGTERHGGRGIGHV